MISCPITFALTILVQSACGLSNNHYLLVEQSLLAHDPKRADTIIEKAESEYGSKSRLLYDLDRGMTLHLNR